MTVPLIHVDIDCKVIISDFSNSDVSDRFRCVGFTPGSEIRIVGKLPFKGPITCECNQTKYAIRADDAAQIFVQPT